MCPYCNFSTVSESRLQAHVSAAHAGAGTAPVALPCPLCAERFPDKSQLGHHLSSLHNVGREARNNLLAMVMVDTSSSPVPAATLSTPPTPNAKSPGDPDGKPDTVIESEQTSSKSDSSKPEITKNSDGPSKTDSCDGEIDAIRIGEDGSIDAVNISEKGEPEDQYRCQMCTMTFPNIDGLYTHQNEQNHLELKNTPRGPGYLCWKKGCNQYFKTGQALQVHFREIHDKRDQLSVSERHVYKYRCTQCSLAFKTLDKLQLHTHYHVIRAATKCSMCGRSFRSISALRKHVEENHLDTMTETELELYRSSLNAAPPMMLNMSESADPESDGEDSPSFNSKDFTAEDEDEDMMDDSVDGNPEGPEGSSFEDYLNSQAIAEDSYIDPNRKYKCHRCKVAFTKQNYLVAHNRTVMHRKGDKSVSYPMDKYLDPNRPYKCDICKESFTQKNILLVHFNSVSHLHKKKQVDQQLDAPASTSPSSSTSQVPPLSPAAATSVPSSSASNGSSNNSDDKKPYKCNICKVSYSQGTTLDIHMRSVLHQTKASKLQELVMTGQVDPSQPLIEQPDMTKAQQQHQKVIQDMMQMQKAAVQQQLSPGMTIGQPQVMFPMMPTPPGVPPTSQSSQMSAQSQSNASQQGDKSALQTSSSTPDPTPDRTSQNPTPQPQSKPDTPSSTSEMIADAKEIENSVSACNRCNSIFASHEALVQHQQMYCFSAPRYMARFKPHVHKNLLENFGFECVMQFNEFNQRRKKPEAELKEKKDEEPSSEQKPEKPVEKENKEEENMEVDEAGRTDEVKEEKKDDKKEEEIDMPELNKCVCQRCEKEFSSIWVLKAHQEEVHKDIVPIDMVEEFSAKFRENFEKKQPQPIVIEPQPAQSQPSTPKTPVIEKRRERESTEIKMELPPGFEQMGLHPSMFGMDLATAQMMQMPFMNMMPMNMMNMIPMNMPMAMNMHPPLMPMMMQMGPDANFASIPGMPPMMDPNFLMKQQQQQAAAAAAAAQNKRARTRISDDQLKILRTYFDINNSPSEEQIQEMSDKSGLPQKVIKHWFRNTLFKERQRNKDSPYNFNIPPSTSLNLEEYERTGKLPTETNNNSDEQNKNREQDDGKIEVKLEKTNNDQEQGSAAASVTSTVDSQDQESVSGSESANESSAPASASSTPVPPSATHSEIVSALNSSPFAHHLPKFDPASLASHLHHAPPHLQLNPAHLGLGHPKTPSQGHHNNLHLVSPPGSQINTPGSSATKRANRTRFTDYQIKILQEFFEQNAYPKDDDLDHLSKMLNLSPRVIVVWFQNARQKARKNYENQPPLDMSEDGTRYQRTPGLNYQCKKCLTVFQRYYELIRHQKTHCYKDANHSNASRSGSSLIVSPQNSQDSFKSETSTPERTPEKPVPVSSSAMTSTPTSTTSSTSSTAGQYKCDKCNLTFNRFDLWHEHQNVHVMNPSLFPNFPADSAFAMLQSVAQQQQQQQQQLHKEMLPLSANQIKQEEMKSPQKRKASEDSLDEDDSGSIKNDHDQPRDKRLRTTILPEQLDYLYQKYQIDCNPSRKQLESIAEEVGLKKRVVQVWFQNTRARERKGQYRAHQQLIHKRCPFCRALFRNRSALESHLATKHPEEMAKGNITIDSIPDATLESLNSPVTSSTPVSSATSPANSLEMSKLMANPFNMPEPFVPFMPPGSAGLPSPNFPGAMQVNMKRLYEDSLKKYLDELSGASHVGKAHSVPEAHSSSTPNQKKTGTTVTPSPKSTPISSKVKEDPDTPLDLSKPVDLSKPMRQDTLEDRSYDDFNRSINFDDSMSETKSECNLSEFGDSNPASPNTSTASSSSLNKDRSLTPGHLSHQSKRFRTQMTSLQVKVMKKLFIDYKTPTMAECEMLGREIGLPKRVIQVWFQNARAKEKKSKLTYTKTFGTDLEVPRPPEECKLCNFKYSHKYTIQDHIFTKRHIENVKGFLSSQADSQQDYIDPNTMTQLIRQRDMERGPKSHSHNLMSPTKGSGGSGGSGAAEAQQLAAHPHLAQLHAMGLQALSSPGPNQEKQSSGKKDVKPEQKYSDKKAKEDEAKAANNPFGIPGLQGQVDFGAGYMPYLYPGMGNFYPGVGMLPGVVPGVMPGAESMFMYDPSTFGTPLTLLQIPTEAIAAVQAKVQDSQCTLTSYCQDNGSLSSVRSRLSPANAAQLTKTSVDVGFICKKCHMVYPGKEGCLNHQQQLCYQGEKHLAEKKTMVKLEQVQYHCSACNSSHNTAKEFEKHVATDGHKKKVIPSSGSEDTAAATSQLNDASQKTPETSDGQ